MNIYNILGYAVESKRYGRRQIEKPYSLKIVLEK